MSVYTTVFSMNIRLQQQQKHDSCSRSAYTKIAFEVRYLYSSFLWTSHFLFVYQLLNLFIAGDEQYFDISWNKMCDNIHSDYGNFDTKKNRKNTNQTTINGNDKMEYNLPKITLLSI